MVTQFQQQVYDVLCKVPAGKVTTYGAIAKALGKGGFGSRAVGMALNKNPYAPQVPCHRVVSSDGSIGGFATGCGNKIKLLEKEGVQVRDSRVLRFEQIVVKQF